ncbi:multiple inositol polyphosphate phosphatase 1 isoform X5 [Phoenix dactylifera]|uniref:Multiple inositol polyphosphate phosphatase 1 n=1 Tax=Phoenix dactylifera TaxID=42345 RepID=A0A8B7C5F2_PHODC|nr:multiple inositol polyphosphate phosphatase 1 isoform X5 [Phoenix dactylifera]
MAFAFSSILLALLLAPSLLVRPSAGESFDVRQHLSTVSRYGAAKDPNNANFVPSAIPDGCKAVHLNLVARHGTRSPTKKRIKELDQLAIRLDTLLNDARESQKGSSLEKIPKWLSGWQSPWKGREKGGELISKGEDELYHLGIRVREIFPALFDEEYHPDIFTIRATQVPRASASAVAFGMGLFSGKGSLGPGQHRAFSVLSESRASDICLRFFDTCQTYKEFRSSQEPAVEKLKEPILDEITSSLVTRFQLNFTRRDVASLWFLCKQEASLLEITDQACALFSAYEVSLLEWTDDLEVFVLKGYGKAINYRMGVPLLQEVVQSMEQAIMAKEVTSLSFQKTAPLQLSRRQGSALHMLRHLYPLPVCSGSFLRDLNLSKYKESNPYACLRSLPRKEIGGAVLWHLFLEIICWLCTSVLVIILVASCCLELTEASILCMFCTMKSQLPCQVVATWIFAHLRFSRKELSTPI